MPATVDTGNLCRSQFLLFLFWNCCFINLFGLQKIILSCNINYKGLRILTIIRQVLIEQRCFLVPGPPNLALSLQLQHWPHHHSSNPDNFRSYETAGAAQESSNPFSHLLFASAEPSKSISPFSIASQLACETTTALLAHPYCMRGGVISVNYVPEHLITYLSIYA